MSQPEQTPKEFRLIPPGPVQKKRKNIITKLPQAKPEWSLKDVIDASSRAGTPAPSWILRKEQKSGKVAKKEEPKPGAPANYSLRGPASTELRVSHEPSINAYNYFALMKQKDGFLLMPVSHCYSAKPPVRRPQHVLSLEEAERRMADRKGGNDSQLMPKAVKQELQEQAEREAEEGAGRSAGEGLMAVPHKAAVDVGLDDAYEEELADELFGSEEEEGGQARGGKKGRARGKAAAAAAAAAEDDEKEDEDERPEDIYAGEEDALRPEMPGKAEDWEHADEYQDDDLDVGQAEEEEPEDPAEARDLGIAGPEVEEEGPEEEEDEEGAAARKLEEVQAAVEAAAAAGDVAAVGAPAEGPAGDEDEDMDLDAFAEQLQAGQGTPAAARERSPAPAAALAQAAQQQQQRQSPAPSNLGPGAAKRKPERSPAPEAAKKARKEPSPAPPAAAAAAAAGGARQRASTATPPPSAAAQAQRRQSATPPAPAAPAAAVAAAGAAAVVAAPSPEAILALVTSRGRVLLKDLAQHFRVKALSKDDKERYKHNMLKVCRSVKEGGDIYVVPR